MKEKLASLETAASSVKTGDLIGLTTSTTDNAPMAFLREVIRRGTKQLRLVTLTGGGLNADLMIGAGVVAEYETCSCVLGPYGRCAKLSTCVTCGADEDERYHLRGAV